MCLAGQLHRGEGGSGVEAVVAGDLGQLISLCDLLGECIMLSPVGPKLEVRAEIREAVTDGVLASWGWLLSFPGGSDGKESACNAGDPGLISGPRRSPGEGNGSPLQYSCLENPMDGGTWWAIAHRVAKSQTLLSWT